MIVHLLSLYFFCFYYKKLPFWIQIQEGKWMRICDNLKYGTGTYFLFTPCEHVRKEDMENETTNDRYL